MFDDLETYIGTTSKVTSAGLTFESYPSRELGKAPDKK